MMRTLKKLNLANVPTRLVHLPALDRLIGCEVWVKRDDESAAGPAGNKIRKLEYLLADAQERNATTLITCGGHQSNHARATALLAAELGFKCTLLLRTSNPSAPPPPTGNLLLDRMAGARVRFITPEQYRARDGLMASVAQELSEQGERPYVIPEGGSNGLGALGYVDAMAEVRQQRDQGSVAGARSFDAVVHACGSGGTAAGVALGARRFGVAKAVHAIAVCDDKRYFDEVVLRIVKEAVALDPETRRKRMPRDPRRVEGPCLRHRQRRATRLHPRSGAKNRALFDPVYTGKALFGLSRLDPKPSCVLFIHTGGLPGLLAQAEDLARLLHSPPTPRV